MYAGGISYLSSCSFGFIGRVSAEPVAIAVRAKSKIEKMLDIVENFIGWKSLEHEVIYSARDSYPIHNPESPRWRASLIHDSNLVENYL